MAKLFNRNTKTAPSSQYPRVPFHVLRFFQLMSSLVVGGIMSYFMWHLRHDNYGVPWTFIWLLAASLASILVLSFTIFFHCCTGLHPHLNISLNSFLSVLWALSWSLLTWYMSGTLKNMCDIEHWNEDVGIMVCRIYKALFTFTLLGLLSTLGALVLDIIVLRKSSARGMYRLQDHGEKSRPEATRGPYTDNSEGYALGGLAAPRESEAWEEPRPSIGPYSEQDREQSEKLVVGDRGSFDGRSSHFREEDFHDEDTGYHGGAHSSRP